MNPLVLILVPILVVILIAIIILIFILISKKHFNDSVSDIERKAEELCKYVQENVATMVHRFYFISQQNSDFVPIYEDFRTQKDTLVNTYEKDLLAKAKKVNELKGHKKKQIKLALIDANNCYEAYQKAIVSLEDKMNPYLLKDDACHNEAIPYQRRFREAKEYYLAHKEELSLMDGAIQKVFELIENQFEEFEKSSSSAHYEEASSKLKDIDKILKEVELGFEKLPSLCSRLSYILPQRINELQEQHLLLEKEKYPLHHLKVNVTLDQVQKRMEEIKRQLMRFIYKNADKQIDELEHILENLKKAFNEEVEAKLYFDENNKKATQDEFNIKKRFMNLKKVLPEYKKIYWVQEKYFDSLSELQNDISTLEKMSTELERYLMISYMQPYTIIVSKLKDVQGEIEKILTLLSDFDTYLKSLKADSEKAFVFLNEKFVSLKRLEKTLLEMNVPHYSATLKNEISECYGHLESIGMLIKTRPINVEAINIEVSKAEEIEIRLVDEVNSQNAKLHEAEDAVVYANRYRQAFSDVRQALTRAEDAFLEGDFVTTLDEAVSIELKMNPTSND